MNNFNNILAVLCKTKFKHHILGKTLMVLLAFFHWISNVHIHLHGFDMVLFMCSLLQA